MSTTTAAPTRIEQRFADLAGEGRKAFIAYITAGDPDLDTTRDHVRRLEDAGVDVVELGIPFSDPVADGIVNQQAAARALAAGATYRKVCGRVASIRKASDIPLLFFSYLNPLLAGTYAANIRAGAKAGVDGYLILDLPGGATDDYVRPLREAGVNYIPLVTPTTAEARLPGLLRPAGGFVYAVSREGVTGMQKSMSGEAVGVVERARRHTRLPIAIGFGVSDAAQAAAAARAADGVVVGSAIVKALHEAGGSAPALRKVQRWVADMVRAVHGD